MAAIATRADAPVTGLDVSVYEVPTDRPESDGTLGWDATTAIVVECHAGGETGIGYTYADAAAAALIAGTLRPVVEGADALSPPRAWARMSEAVRNSVHTGLCALAISAVDIALHDLRARLLGVCLADALGRWHEGIAIYGSGGFTSYDDDTLRRQAEGWARLGVERVKIKVGRDPVRDGHRLDVVRGAVGPNVALMVDANGAFVPARALAAAHETYAPRGVDWFEEPVSSDDRAGLRRVRDGAPPGIAIAAGEYGTSLFEFEALLAAGAIDVLQPDVTRCGGATGVLRADAVAKAHAVPTSAHCAPTVAAHVCCACETALHLEYFHDHVRLESMLFDGTPDPEGGRLVPDRSRPGLGVELRRADAERFRR